MPLPITCSRWSAAALISAGALVLFDAPAAPAPTRSETMSSAEKTRKALDQPITLEFSEQPLRQAIDQLREQTKVNFVLDRYTIQQLGIDEESSPVSVKLQDAKLRPALRKILGQYNLGYVILDDSVVITTPEMAIYRQLRQPVSVDLDNMPLNSALKQLAQRTATNLVIDAKVAKEAQTGVTLQLDEVPLETAVRLMAELANLKAARVGNVLLVTTEARATKLRAEPDLITPPALPGAEPVLKAGGLRCGGVIRDPVPPVAPPPPAPGGAPPAREPKP